MHLPKLTMALPMNEMMKPPMLLLALTAGCLMTSATGAMAETRNVILIIGDGMDSHQITIARNYLHGATGRLTLDTMPHLSSAQVITMNERKPDQPVFVADSASSGTALATGEVTSRGRIATTAGTDQPLPSIAELAMAAGYRAGIVTTSSVTDATPAVFAAHINYRFCENPTEMVTDSVDCSAYLKVNGGPGSVAEQLAESGLDVILGGGSMHFEQQAEMTTASVLDLARQHGFKIVNSRRQLVDVIATANGQGKLLGLFAEKHLAVRMQGENGRVAEAVERSLLNRLHSALGSVTLPEPMGCEPNPAAQDTPSLVSLARAAVLHLEAAVRHNRGLGSDAGSASSRARQQQGFMLMVESASIDKQSHVRNPCGSIGELEQLDEVVAFAMDYAKAQPGTLVLVTSDHSHAAQLIPETTLYARLQLPIYTPGKMARLITRDGSLMGVNYATNNFFAEEHTGAAVPVYANDEIKGGLPAYMLQSDVFGLMRDHLDLR